MGFITAITKLNDTIFVILIDQHAMDERIRYESLLRGKKIYQVFIQIKSVFNSTWQTQKKSRRKYFLAKNNNIILIVIFFIDYRNSKNIFKSMRLNRPIEISKVSLSIVDLVVHKRSQLFNYGINAVKKNDCTIIISTIPKCFARIRNIENLTRHLEILLDEISEFVVKDVDVTTIPITIHNAIASEACHGN